MKTKILLTTFLIILALLLDKDSIWHCWGQADFLGTDLDDSVLTENYHWTNPDYTLNTWTKVGLSFAEPTLPLAGEVVATRTMNQIADPIVFIEANRTVMFYDVNWNNAGNGLAASIDYVTYTGQYKHLWKPAPIVSATDIAQTSNVSTVVPSGHTTTVLPNRTSTVRQT